MAAGSDKINGGRGVWGGGEAWRVTADDSIQLHATYGILII